MQVKYHRRFASPFLHCSASIGWVFISFQTFFRSYYSLFLGHDTRYPQGQVEDRQMLVSPIN